MSELKRLQALFYGLVTAPEPVSKQAVSLAELAADFRGSELASPVERLDIYADMYFFRIRDVLAEQFPLLVTALGDERFHNLVTDYLALLPPKHPSLRYVGARLAGFLTEQRYQPAWLAELALLEWAYVDVFDGPDVELLRMADVQAMTPESLAKLSLPLVPTHRLLRTQHRVDQIGEDGGEPAAEPAAILIWRRELHAAHRAVDETEAGMLESCAQGTVDLAALCERLAETLSEEQAATQAFTLLSRWLAEGLIRKVASVVDPSI